MVQEATPQIEDKVNPINMNLFDKAVSATPRDIQEDPRFYNESGHIHPDRISRLRNTVGDNCD